MVSALLNSSKVIPSRAARDGQLPVRKSSHQRPLKDWIPQSSGDEEREVHKMKLRP